MTALLHLDGVSGRYAAVTALHPLTLAVADGARHAVIGPNGAGKSTLLHLIAGSLPAAAGRIVLAGRDITRLRPAARARTGIARTFQHPGVVDALSAGDNIRLALPRPPRLRRGLRAAAVVDALDRVGLADQVARPAGELPYGQRRLLELGMALVAQPRLLLLDEPSAGLGPAEVDQLTTIVTGLPATTTVVLVDHHLPLIWAVADTVTVLHHGRHLSTGTPAAVQADPHVRDAYLKPPTQSNASPPRRPGRPRIPPPALLQVRGLRAGYHGADVLHDLDLDLRRGTVHGLLGRNGAGKTTLLNTIAGLHRPRAGHLRLDGHDLHPATPLATRRRIAIVPQGRRLYAQLTVAEHLLLAARRRPSTQPCDLDAIAALTSPLDGARGRYPRQLSGGQQQFLALARALLTGPDLLLLDEPTEGLAPSIVADLRTILGQLADTGLTVLLAEQNLTFALDLASHLTVLDDGHTALQTDLPRSTIRPPSPPCTPGSVSPPELTRDQPPSPVSPGREPPDPAPPPARYPCGPADAGHAHPGP